MSPTSFFAKRKKGFPIGNTSYGQNNFCNLDWGVIGSRSDMIVANNYFEQIHADPSFVLYHVWSGTAIVSLADSIHSGSLTVIHATSQPETALNST